jgi:hypothetical protein
VKRAPHLAAACGVILTVLLAVPAFAHDSVWLHHPGGGDARVTSHQTVTVCDYYADGHDVWVRYYRNIDREENWHSTGRPQQGHCHYERAMSAPIVAYRVCISYEGCTGYKYHWEARW